jgi:hypothetical protein
VSVVAHGAQTLLHVLVSSAPDRTGPQRERGKVPTAAHRSWLPLPRRRGVTAAQAAPAAESWAATRTSARECVARRHDDARRSLGSPAGVGLSSWLRRLRGVDPPLRKAQACDRSSACECVGQRNQRGVQWALRRMSSHTTSATRIQNAKISGIPTPNMVAAYWRVTDSPEHRRKRVPDSGMRVCVGRRLARVTPETRATGTVDWLCYSCLRAGTKVPAVTLRQGTALCETCALGEGQSLTLPAEDLTLALIDGETGRVVYAPTPRSWPTFSLTPPDPHA